MSSYLSSFHMLCTASSAALTSASVLRYDGLASAATSVRVSRPAASQSMTTAFRGCSAQLLLGVPSATGKCACSTHDEQGIGGGGQEGRQQHIAGLGTTSCTPWTPPKPGESLMLGGSLVLSYICSLRDYFISAPSLALGKGCLPQPPFAPSPQPPHIPGNQAQVPATLPTPAACLRSPSPLLAAAAHRSGLAAPEGRQQQTGRIKQLFQTTDSCAPRVLFPRVLL